MPLESLRARTMLMTSAQDKTTIRQECAASNEAGLQGHLHDFGTGIVDHPSRLCPY